MRDDNHVHNKITNKDNFLDSRGNLIFLNCCKQNVEENILLRIINHKQIVRITNRTKKGSEKYLNLIDIKNWKVPGAINAQT